MPGAIDDAYTRNVARVLRSLSQEHRIKILSFLSEKGLATFSEIMNELNLSSGKLNFHLKKLRDAGLVTVGEGGAYELTELGKWVLARLRELERLGEERRPLVDFRGLPQNVALSELAKELACSSSVHDAEMLIGELYRKLSRIAPFVSKECLLLIAQIELCDREPSFVCLPADKASIVFKSFTSDLYAGERDQLCRDLANLHAAKILSPLFQELQLKGLVYLKDPVYSLSKAQVIAVGVPKGVRLTEVVGRLTAAALELVVVPEEGAQLEDLELLDRLVEPGRVTVVLESEGASHLRLRRIGIVAHGEKAWRDGGALLETVNSPTAVLFSRGSRVPSLSLAEVPVPEPGEAFIVTLRLASPLPVLYAEMRRGKVDVYHFLDQIAREAESVGEKLTAPQARRALKGYASSVELLKPQLAIAGFEAALRLHHPALEAPRAAELSKRFWSTLIGEFDGVDVTAAMADERLYAFSRFKLFNPLGSYALSIARPLEELAMLEGTVQGLLGGGSCLALKVKGYLSSEQMAETLKVAELSGVKRVSFHLEFTSCESCLSTSVGWKGVCDLCLSGNVVQLARPLDVYKPVDAIPPEVLEEYSRRVATVAGVQAH
jgi:DNA-binding HxlR family transcriptional regulator